MLIIGDSISLGYTPHVAAALKDKAHVHHHRGNAGPTMRGIEQLDQWLGNPKWDVIHFNWGLWDMYGWRYEKIDRSPAEYAKRLDTLVTRLKKTGAKLIWATTTPACPEAEHKCKVKITPKLEAQYLAAAAAVMKKHGVAINDLHSFIKPHMKTVGKGAHDVHFTKDGYKMLAGKVAEHVTAATNQE